jgi:hypothetical protein
MQNTAYPELSLKIVANVYTWIVAKLESDEAFAALMVADTPSGGVMTNYAFDDGEEAFARCRWQLSGELADTTAYALIFDAWTEVEGKAPVPTLVLQVEKRGAATVPVFAQTYELKEKPGSSSREFTPLEEFRLVGHREPWLVGPAEQAEAPKWS